MATSRRKALRLWAAGLFLAGFACGAVIFVRALNASPATAGYVLNADGEAVPVSPLDSRAARRELELYGGPSAIWMAEFEEWLSGATRSKGVAISVIVAGALGSAGCLMAADAIHDPDDGDDDGGDDDDGDEGNLA